MSYQIEMAERICCHHCGTLNWAAAPLCGRCQTALIAPVASRAQGKTFTQKVARLFEIVDYLLIVPATLGLGVGLLMAFSAATGGAPLGLLWVIALLAPYLLGCYLFHGFFRHSRGRGFRGGPAVLWALTALFNVPHFLYSAFIFRTLLAQPDGGLWMAGLSSLWFGAVVFLSAWCWRKTLLDGAEA
jgi:hypothetical protein